MDRRALVFNGGALILGLAKSSFAATREPERRGTGWYARRDIVLGRNVPR
ncbi:MAG TPA: hypothetical protein VFZ95_00080 [Steroidobacteraceae bacterium]